LNLDERKDLFLRPGFAISNSSKSDVIIKYFIDEENFDIYEIDGVLFRLGEKTFSPFCRFPCDQLIYQRCYSLTTK
jgi:hypothetical protein